MQRKHDWRRNVLWFVVAVLAQGTGGSASSTGARYRATCCMDIRSHLPWRNSRSSSSSALWNFLYCDMKCWKKLRHLRERGVSEFGRGYGNRVLLDWRQSVELCIYRWAWHEKQKIKSHHSSLQRICWQHIGLRKSKHNCNKGQNGRALSGVQRSRVYSFDELALEFFCWLGVAVTRHIFTSTICCWQRHLLANLCHWTQPGSKDMNFDTGIVCFREWCSWCLIVHLSQWLTLQSCSGYATAQTVSFTVQRAGQSFGMLKETTFPR